MVTLMENGKIVYRTSKGKCFPFPQTGDPVLPERCTPPIQTLMAGIPRNFEVFDPLDVHCNRLGCSPSGAFGVLFGHPWPSSLAEVTQHIPNTAQNYKSSTMPKALKFLTQQKRS
jgi:hypothetical protein